MMEIGRRSFFLSMHAARSGCAYELEFYITHKYLLTGAAEYV